MTQRFFLKWSNPVSTSRKIFIRDYIYDGLGDQSRYTLDQWKQRCINFNKTNGLIYCGEATEKDWIKYNNILKV